MECYSTHLDGPSILVPDRMSIPRIYHGGADSNPLGLVWKPTFPVFSPGWHPTRKSRPAQISPAFGSRPAGEPVPTPLFPWGRRSPPLRSGRGFLGRERLRLPVQAERLRLPSQGVQAKPPRGPPHPGHAATPHSRPGCALLLRRCRTSPPLRSPSPPPPPPPPLRVASAALLSCGNYVCLILSLLIIVPCILLQKYAPLRLFMASYLVLLLI
jgi:hypothetical protein